MHKLFHLIYGDWRVIERLAVPGYQSLVRQRCSGCNKTRVREVFDS